MVRYAIAHTRIQTPAYVEVPPCPEQELQEQIRQLSVSDRLTLITTIIQSLQNTAQEEDWQYLVTRPHPWRRQLYIKGRKLLALTVWQDMMANEMSPEQAADYTIENQFVILNQWNY